MAQLPSLMKATLEDLSYSLAKGHFTSVELVKAYLSRIKQVNDTVHAVTEIDPDALRAAAELDEDRQKGLLRGLLHGIPILVKNNIAVRGMGNTAGSSLLVGAEAAMEACVVEKLRAEGAIILGKTNLSQWANFRTSDFSITGWTVDGGQTYAAYHPEQAAGGSSSGSGVAVDLALAWAALGTETDGSVLDPAYRNGIVGIKPTVGLTSRHMVIPVSQHFDTVGPMARTVRDAAHLLQAIAGTDPRDPYTLAIPPSGVPDYVSECDVPNPFVGARIGVPWNIINQALEQKSWLIAEMDAFKAALSVLEEAGATVVEANCTVAGEEFMMVEREITFADFPRDLASYLSQLTSNPSNIRTLADVRAQTRANPPEGWPERDTGLWDEILNLRTEGQRDTEAAYRHLRALSDRGGPIGAMEKHDLAAMAMPTSLTQLWGAVGGGPGITVPMGRCPSSTPVLYKQGRTDLVDVGPGIPFGLCFLGRRWEEGKLIRLAHDYERRTGWRGTAKRIVEPDAELGRC